MAGSRRKKAKTAANPEANTAANPEAKTAANPEAKKAAGYFSGKAPLAETELTGVKGRGLF